MWFGTYDGLNRYDGKSFKVFKHNPKNNYSISHNSITTILGWKKIEEEEIVEDIF